MLFQEIEAERDHWKKKHSELLTALRGISSLWPMPPHCADINPEWVGERDGKMRAILLEAAILNARAAIAKDAL